MSIGVKATMTNQPKPPGDEPAIRVVMMPKDTNAEGTIFGGVILALMDQAAYIEAMRQAHHRYVTISFKETEFLKPVYVGDVLSIYAETARIGSGYPHSSRRFWQLRRSRKQDARKSCFPRDVGPVGWGSIGVSRSRTDGLFSARITMVRSIGS